MSFEYATQKDIKRGSSWLITIRESWKARTVKKRTQGNIEKAPQSKRIHKQYRLAN